VLRTIESDFIIQAVDGAESGRRTESDVRLSYTQVLAVDSAALNKSTPLFQSRVSFNLDRASGVDAGDGRRPPRNRKGDGFAGSFTRERSRFVRSRRPRRIEYQMDLH
jgi:hypothetical protein